jgi:hypothetical protein
MHIKIKGEESVDRFHKAKIWKFLSSLKRASGNFKTFWETTNSLVNGEREMLLSFFYFFTMNAI